MNQNLWKPVSTAPRNGTFFIAYSGTNMYIVNWPIGCAPGRWSRSRKEWFGAATINEDELSAWHPLPEPPAIENILNNNDYEGLIEPVLFEVQPEDIPEEPILTEDGPWDDVPHRVRTFVSVRRTRIDDGGWALDAVASDGTAWCRIQRRDTEIKWQRLPDLPQD